MAPNPIWLMSLQWRIMMQTQGWPCEGAGGRLPFCKPRSETQEINPPNILIWDIWYSELWENKFLFFNPPICGIDIPYLWYWYTIPIHFLCVLCTSLYDDLSYHSWNLYSSQDERFFKKFSSKKNGDSNSITFTNPRRKENSKSNKNREKQCN